jgi:hypothetical protein
MGKLDALVTDHLLERLFQPERVALILASLSSRRAEQATPLNSRIVYLQREMIEADDKLKRPKNDVCEFESSQPSQAVVSPHHLRFSFRLAHSALSGGQPAPLFAGEPSGMDGAQQGNDSCQACTTKRSSSTV